MSEKPPMNDPEDELTRLWQQQELEGKSMSLETIRKKAGSFERSVRWRNLREYAGAAIVIVFFGIAIFRAPNNFMRFGSGLSVLAAIYITYSLHTRGSAQHIPDDRARMTLVQFHRSSLERQRDLLQDIWSWYLLPFVPGIIMIMVGAAVRDGAIFNPQRTPEQARHGVGILIFTIFMFALSFIIAAINKRAARKLQSQIDVLNARERE